MQILGQDSAQINTAPTASSKLIPTAHSKLTEESGRKLVDALHRLEAQLDGVSDGRDRGTGSTSGKKADAELAAVEGAGHVPSLVNIGVGVVVGHVLAKALFKSK
jgi:hypothetical protein